MNGKVSPSLEDYLEAVYFLTRSTGDEARVTDVAAHLNISKPSVNKAMNILKSKGLINHEHYGNVSLSKEGLEIAENVARRHIIIKTFLKDVLGSDNDTAEQEACLIEHSVSTDTINRLEKLVVNFTGNPIEL